MNRPTSPLGLLDLRLLRSRWPSLFVLIGTLFLSPIVLIGAPSRDAETSSPVVAGSAATATAQRNFRSILIQRSALDAAQQLILDAAASHRLTVGRVDYAQEVDQAGRFTVASMRLPVSGRYDDLRSFIESALVAQPALSLRHLTIQRETSAEVNDTPPLLSATLTMHLLLGERDHP